MSRRPIIGITPTPSLADKPHGTFYCYSLHDTYVRSVYQAGGMPVILPWVENAATESLGAIDGLIVSGGGDIDPAQYGQQPHEESYGIDEGRDSFEISLVRDAAEHDMPLLAICRGIQVMAVAFGGSLHQHVADVVSGNVDHRQHKAGFSQHERSHRVVLENTPNPVSALLGKTELMVNSFHHQALASVPEPLCLAGRADDGTIEAVWHPEMSFGIGVQWHPEMLTPEFDDHAAFFSALVEVAANRLAVTA